METPPDTTMAHHHGTTVDHHGTTLALPQALHRPAELVSGTAEVRAVFPDAQLLRGRLCSVVTGGAAQQRSAMGCLGTSGATDGYGWSVII